MDIFLEDVMLFQFCMIPNLNYIIHGKFFEKAIYSCHGRGYRTVNFTKASYEKLSMLHIVRATRRILHLSGIEHMLSPSKF